MALSSVLNRLENPPPGSKDNKFIIAGSMETGAGVSIKQEIRDIQVTNSGGGSEGHLFIYTAGTITEFTAVMSGGGTGGAETIDITLEKQGSPNVAIAGSLVQFSNNTPEGITDTASPTGANADLIDGDVLVFKVTGSLPTNYAVSCTVKIQLD